MKVHLVFPHGSEAVRAAVREIAEVTYLDTTLDTAVQWAASNREGNPDVIIVNAGVDVSLVDTKTANRLPWNEVFAKRLQEIRLSRPSSRIIVLLPPEKEKEKQFVSSLVALGIYDIYFAQEFDREDLRNWLENEKTLADVQQFLPAAGPGSVKQVEPKASPPPQTPKRSALDSLKEALAGRKERVKRAHADRKPKRPAAPAEGIRPLPEIEIDVAKLPEPPKPDTAVADGPGKGLCLYSIEGGIPGAVLVDTLEELKEKVKGEQPWGVVLGGMVPGLTSIIAQVRRLSPTLVIGVYGTEKQENYVAGADECFTALDTAAVNRMKKRGERLKQLFEEASKDQLTGCNGRRFLKAFLAEQVEFYRREGIPLSILLCDLDKFKVVNDTHGHQAGDEVLVKFSQFLQARLRQGDIVARYGGEEFVVVFSRTCMEEAMEIAERLCKGWEKEKVYGSTFSGGVAWLKKGTETPDLLIAAADQALYQAKESGRNRILPFDQGLPRESLQEEIIPAAAETAVVIPLTPGSRIAKTRGDVTGAAKTLVVASLRGSPGSSTLAATVAEHLAKHEKTVLVDCDLCGRSLGARFGLSPQEVANRDWRQGNLPVVTGGVMVYPLDPANDQDAAEDQLEGILDEASSGGGWLVIDAGNDPAKWWFAMASSYADTVLWVVKDDAALISQMRLRWPGRPRVSSQEMIILYGPGNIKGIEEIFVTPCLQITGSKDAKGTRQLGQALKQAHLGQVPKVLIVGFKNISKNLKSFCNVFGSAKEAGAWLDVNKPDVALLSNHMKGGDLLEHDLKKLHVPAYRLPKSELDNALAKMGWM